MRHSQNLQVLGLGRGRGFSHIHINKMDLLSESIVTLLRQVIIFFPLPLFLKNIGMKFFSVPFTWLIGSPLLSHISNPFLNFFIIKLQIAIFLKCLGVLISLTFVLTIIIKLIFGLNDAFFLATILITKDTHVLILQQIIYT